MDTRPAAAVYRSAPQRPRLVRDLVFDRLPLAVRDRLTRGIVNGALPDPLLAARSAAALRALRVFTAITLAAALGALVLWTRDLGSLYSEHALQPTAYAAPYAVLCFLAAAGAAAALHLRKHQRGAPFPSGRYLFPLDLVEATGGRLRVTALDTARRVEARARAVAVIFEDGHEITLALPRREAPAAIATNLTAEIEAARELSRPADELRLDRIDPFFEVRVSDDWASAADTAAARGRAALTTAVIAAALLAVPAGIGLVRAHNAVSDDLMFEDAVSDKPGASRAAKIARYIERGSRHHGELGKYLGLVAEGNSDVLRRYRARGGALGAAADEALFEMVKSNPFELVRYLRTDGAHAVEADEALFALARQRDTIDAYQQYLQAGTLHAGEVKRELLPEADWKQASRSPLVGSLFTFLRRNPGSPHEDEAWKSIHKAYASDREHHAHDGKRVAEAMLLLLEERADPRVDLVITTPPSDAVAEADAALAEKFRGRALPAADHFSQAKLTSLRDDVREAVAAAFGRMFLRGTVEVTPPGDEPGRPRVEIAIVPVSTGYAEWRSLLDAEGEPKHVTPRVSFVVQIRALVPGGPGRDEVTDTWKVGVDDESDAKILARTADGITRTPQEMIEDAYAIFLLGVPRRIAESFPEHL